MSLISDIFQNEFQTTVKSFSPLSGGDINEVFLVDDGESNQVIKINDATSYPRMLELEADALKFMFATKTIKIPEVFAFGELDGKQYLILEYIDNGTRDGSYWERIAKGLGDLHRSTNDLFGWKEDNYIGYLKQKNNHYSDWNSFFIHCRMEPLIESAFNDKKLNQVHLRKFDSMFQELDSIFPKEAPALLHGDLWGGNLMDGLIDPAIYYGHREMDLAMTQMFGGFTNDFIEIYNRYAPLEKGVDSRIPFYNLYPNLTHLNMFGTSYLSGIEMVIDKF